MPTFLYYFTINIGVFCQFAIIIVNSFHNIDIFALYFSYILYYNSIDIEKRENTMGKSFDGIDIFFIVLISIYLIVLILFITIFICNYFDVKNGKQISKKKNNKRKAIKENNKLSKTNKNKFNTLR